MFSRGYWRQNYNQDKLSGADTYTWHSYHEETHIRVRAPKLLPAGVPFAGQCFVYGDVKDAFFHRHHRYSRVTFLMVAHPLVYVSTNHLQKCILSQLAILENACTPNSARVILQVVAVTRARVCDRARIRRYARRESVRTMTGQPDSQSGRVVTAPLKEENETKSPTSLCHLQSDGYQPIGPSFARWLGLSLSLPFSLPLPPFSFSPPPLPRPLFPLSLWFVQCSTMRFSSAETTGWVHCAEICVCSSLFLSLHRFSFSLFLLFP